ncbi:MAG: helix-turn-helix domain-containing protein [Pirellulales bacterium]
MGNTRDFAEVIRRNLASNRQLAGAVNDEYLRVNVAQQIYAARKSAGLTQRELAEACGMRQSAIARLESTDYEGHKLDTVRRVAAALNLRIELTFVAPVEACKPHKGATSKKKTTTRRRSR